MRKSLEQLTVDTKKYKEAVDIILFYHDLYKTYSVLAA